MDTSIFSDLSTAAIERWLASGDADPVAAKAAGVDDRPAAVPGPDDDATIPLTFKPAIVLGVGGTGIEVAHGVLHLRDRFVAEAGHSLAARQRADTIFVFGVDTWPHPRLKALGPGNWLTLPQNPLGVDGRVQSLWRANSHFRAVWPSVNGGPYRPGDYIDGAGQDRLKGRLAWLLSQFQGGQSVVSMVQAALQQIQNVLGLAPVIADGTFEIPIYVVRGIGGGTGSGVTDPLAVELRQALPGYCRFIAVEILPDAAELKTQESEHPSLRANGAVALAERERLLSGNHALAPFFARDDVARALLAGESPFLYTYLFSRRNAKSLTMTVEGQAEALVAHCLATEIFLSAADQVQDPNSQFRQQLAALPNHDGRSCLYASAAVSEFSYRPRLVAASLGSRFAAAAIADRLSLSAARHSEAYAKGRAAADAFIEEHRLSWQTRALRGRLDTPLPGETPLPPAPALTQGFPAWDAAGADDLPGVVARRINDFDTWRDRRWRPALAQRVAAALAALRGDNERSLGGALFAAVERHLAGDDGWGFARVAGFLDRLDQRLAAEHDVLMTEIDGPDWKVEPGPGGLKDRVAKRRASASRAVRALRERFGPFGLHASRAKRDFEAQWWNPFSDGERDLIRAQAALALISALSAAHKALALRLAELDTTLTSGVDTLQANARDVLSHRDLGGVLEERLLEDETLVVAAFAEELRSSRVAVPAFADHLLVGEGGVRALLRAAASSPDPARSVRDGAQHLLTRAASRGAALFQPATDALSVWDAFHRELLCRLQLDLIDEPLRRALTSLRQDIHALQGPAANRQRHALLLQAYAEQRLRVCLNRAAPFWNLDARAPIEAPLPLPRPFPLFLVGYDEERYTTFCKNTEMADFLPRVVASLGVKPKDRPGPYAITVYTREGGVPLFYLDRELTRPMLQDAAMVNRARPLFADARFDPSIVEFDPPEPAAARLGYALAAAAHFGLATVSDGGAIVFSLNGHGASAFASASQALDALIQDETLARDLIHQVNRGFAALTEAERRQTIPQVAAAAGSLAATAAQAGHQPERLVWQRAQEAAQRRVQHGQYHVA